MMGKINIIPDDWCEGCERKEKCIGIARCKANRMMAIKLYLHEVIDNTPIAEDVYPDFRQRLHDAVDEYKQDDYSIKGTIGYKCPKCGKGNFLNAEKNCVYCGEPLIKGERSET